MKRVSLYSSSSTSSRAPATLPDAASTRAADAEGQRPQSGDPASASSAAPASAKPRRFRAFLARHERVLLVLSAVLLSSAVFFSYEASKPQSRPITQKVIDASVMHTLENNVLPSASARAFAAIERSVVRVRRIEHSKDKDEDRVRGIGTGVVIVDKGVILTNLHVIDGAERVQVVFFDGLESEATVISTQPENDLAVLQAKTIPDDLPPATLRSTGDLLLGDEVIAVGFPFGIGPSVTSGIISGLRREYRSPEGKQLLTNLIQFDAAANPGNSGGPLVTMDGEVVGIVTAILNPGDQGVFIGIGFAVPIENAASAVGISPF
jgi:S1-C subfamily serine protease